MNYLFMLLSLVLLNFAVSSAFAKEVPIDLKEGDTFPVKTTAPWDDNYVIKCRVSPEVREQIEKTAFDKAKKELRDEVSKNFPSEKEAELKNKVYSELKAENFQRLKDEIYPAVKTELSEKAKKELTEERKDELRHEAMNAFVNQALGTVEFNNFSYKGYRVVALTAKENENSTDNPKLIKAKADQLCRILGYKRSTTAETYYSDAHFEQYYEIVDDALILHDSQQSNACHILFTGFGCTKD